MMESNRPGEGDGDAVVENAKPKLKPPPLYKVVLLNDDFTPMEFVVHILERFFNMAGVQDPDYSQYRIPSSSPTNDALLSEVRSLREEVKALRNDTNSGNRAVATNTGKVVAMTERWEQIGMPQSRSDIYETP